MGFSRQEYSSGLPYPPPVDLPNPGIEPRSPALQVDSLLTEPPGKPKTTGVGRLSLLQGIFLTQKSNWHLLILYHLNYQGSPIQAIHISFYYLLTLVFSTWNAFYPPSAKLYSESKNSVEKSLFDKIMPDISSFSIWIHAVITVVTSLVTLPPPYYLPVCAYVAHIYVYAHTHTEKEKEREHLYVLYLLSFPISLDTA